jgi:hypothetical protein
VILKRYTIVIVGNESGSETELTFCRFWTREAAEEFVARSHTSELTRYEVRRRDKAGHLWRVV